MNLAECSLPQCSAPLAAAALPVSSTHARGDGVQRGSIDAVLRTRYAGTRKLRLNYELVGAATAPVVLSLIHI